MGYNEDDHLIDSIWSDSVEKVLNGVVGSASVLRITQMMDLWQGSETVEQMLHSFASGLD